MSKRTKAPVSKSFEPAVRADGWFNNTTSKNVPGKDKRRSNTHLTERMVEEVAEDLWRGDDICARAIETTPRMELANGFTVGIGDADDAKEQDEAEAEAVNGNQPTNLGRMDRAARLAMLSPYRRRRLAARHGRQMRLDAQDAGAMQKDLDATLERLNTTASFIEAREYARAFGGSAIMPLIEETGRRFDDPKGLQRPLDLRKVREVKGWVVLRPRECFPMAWYPNPLTLDYGAPRAFRVVRDTMGWADTMIIDIHESRLIRFYGVVTSRRQRAMNNSWGESILTRIVETVADFQSGFQGASAALEDFAQAVYKIQGLAELIATKSDDVISRRMANIEFSRSMLRAILIDTEEDFERKPTPMSGYPETLDRLSSRLAAAIGIPVSLLMGEAPAGLNATGEANVDWFFENVHQDREKNLRPQLKKAVGLVMSSLDGPTGGVVPASWSIIFPPLRILSEKESAEIRLKVAQADAAYVAAQVLTPEEVAESRFGGDEWSSETRLDVEAREQVAKAMEDGLAAGDLEHAPKPGLKPVAAPPELGPDGKPLALSTAPAPGDDDPPAEE